MRIMLDPSPENLYSGPSMRILILLIILIFLPNVSSAKHRQLERDYQQDWCARADGRAEVRLPDGTRVDCLTGDHAIEFDFGPKWAEAIGQALYYAMQTGKRAGIALILERIEDRRYWIRLNSVIQYEDLPIDTWKIENF